ncbi:MAG: ABC transporter permease [Actinobacteria bacterium]|nr:ABC transporter permease [Actinomycetota bacterium]
MFIRIKHLIIKEFIQVIRDRRMLFLIFIAPIIQLLLFGYAITTDIKDTPVAMMDLDQTVESRNFISGFTNSGNFSIDYYINSEKEITALLDSGKTQAVIKINPGFEKNIKKGEQAEVEVIIDGSNSNTAVIILNYINQISANYSKSILIKRIDNIERLQGRTISRSIDFFSNEIRVWYNPALKSRVSNIPAVVAFILLISTVMLTSMSIVREREAGTIEQLIVTPIKSAELIIGKTLPFALIGFMDVLIVISISYSWFKIPIKGDLLILFFGMVLYLFTTLGVGLFISTVSRTQQQAMMSTFFFTMPSVMLSGFVFPIENMPKIIQYITYLNPLKYFLVIINGIFLKGIGIKILWPQMAALAVLGSAILLISINRFRKRLE